MTDLRKVFRLESDGSETSIRLKDIKTGDKFTMIESDGTSLGQMQATCDGYIMNIALDIGACQGIFL